MQINIYIAFLLFVISMCSKETTTNLELKYLHYGPGHMILAYLQDGCLVKYSIHLYWVFFSVYIRVFIILY